MVVFCCIIGLETEISIEDGAMIVKTFKAYKEVTYAAI